MHDRLRQIVDEYETLEAQLSDAEVNALVKFLRARFSTQPPWKT